MAKFLSTFVVMGVVLFLISILGFVTHGKMIAEAGTRPSTTTAWIYLGAGFLMLLNGYISHVTNPLRANVNRVNENKS